MKAASSWIRVFLLASLLAALGLSGAALVKSYLEAQASRPLSLGDGPLAPSKTPSPSLPQGSADLSKQSADSIGFVLAVKASDKQPLPSRIRLAERSSSKTVDTLEGTGDETTAFLKSFAGNSDDSGRV